MMSNDFMKYLNNRTTEKAKTAAGESYLQLPPNFARAHMAIGTIIKAIHAEEL